MRFLQNFIAITIAIIQCSVPKAFAQLPANGIVYGITMGSAGTIYNYNPALAMSASNPSVNSITLPTSVSFYGITVSPVLGSSSTTPTFYLVRNGPLWDYYEYYNPTTSTWVNTGHKCHAPNIAGGGGYIYALDGLSGVIFKYSGSGDDTVLTTIPDFSYEGPYDLAADCDGNFYVLNQTGLSSTQFLREYNPMGVLVKSWTLTNPNSLTVRAAAGLGMIGNQFFTDNYNTISNSTTGVVFYSLGTTALKIDSTKSFVSSVGLWQDMGTGPLSPSIPRISITASHNTGCIGGSVTYSAAIASGGSAPVYQWKVNSVNAGTNSPTFTYTPSYGDTIKCVLTSNSACAGTLSATSNVIVATPTYTTTVTPTISITGTGSTYCVFGIDTFSAAVTNAGSTPTYQWKVNNSYRGLNSPRFIWNPNNGDTVSCILTSSHGCVTSVTATSNAWPLIVNNQLTPNVTVTTPQSSICAGSTASFTATAFNGGSSPAFQWTVNNLNVGTNSSSYTYTPSNGDVVKCAMTTSLQCVTGPSALSGGIVMTYATPVTASVSIVASDTEVCSGRSITFTTAAINSGTTPGYQWRVNNSNAGSGASTFTMTPANGDTVRCLMTSALCSNPPTVSSNKIGIKVKSTTVPGISVNTNPAVVGCEGAPITFVSTIVGGGSTPAYQWYKNSLQVMGANTANYVDSFPKNRDTFQAVLVSSEPCPSSPLIWSNAIGLALSPVVTPTAVIIPAGPVQAGAPTIFTVSTTGAGLNPSYQWKKNGIDISGATGASYSSPGLSIGDKISVTMTSDEPCASPIVFTSDTVAVIAATSVTGTMRQPWKATLYPNPNNGGFTVSITAAPGSAGDSFGFEVVNSIGQVIYRTMLQRSGVTTRREITLQEELKPGTYFARIRTPDGVTTDIPFLVEKS